MSTNSATSITAIADVSSLKSNANSAPIPHLNQETLQHFNLNRSAVRVDALLNLNRSAVRVDALLNLTHEFARMLFATDAFIAGSVPLSLFLNKPLLPEQDLDIWISTKTTDLTNFSETSTEKRPKEYVANHLLWKFYLSSCGYITDDSNMNGGVHQNNNNYERMTNIIHHIDFYIHPNTGRKIQIIHTYPVTTFEILKSFDLNICCFYCDSSLQVKHYLPESEIVEIKVNIARYKLSQEPGTREQSRIQKYKARGFSIIL